MSYRVRAMLLTAVICTGIGVIQAAEIKIDSATFGGLKARAIGPAVMSGRISAMDGEATDPVTIWVGAATGGVWKSENAGLSFEPVFDDQPIASIGDLALAPSNPDVIYVGTGEANVRNSVSFGNGVYKSTDGGQSWKHMGLDDTRHISRIVVHPTDPDIAYVAAQGHLWGYTGDRGLFKTSDGGATWPDPNGASMMWDENSGDNNVGAEALIRFLRVVHARADSPAGRVMVLDVGTRRADRPPADEEEPCSPNVRPRPRMSSPRPTTSSTLSIRRFPPSLEMCTRPSRPGRMLTNAPNLVMFTTSPS